MDLDVAVLRSFFLWCTIINAALLVLTWLITMLAGGWVFRMHSRFYPISREAFNVVIYSFVGLLKTFVIFFNFVPYLALLIVSRQ